MRGQLGAETFSLSFEGISEGQKASFFVTNRSIYFFCQPSAKFWGNLSEITAPLPPTAPNYLILKYKVCEKVGAVVGAERGRKGAVVGQKTAVENHLPPIVLIIFQRVRSQGAEGQPEKSEVNTYSGEVPVRIAGLIRSFASSYAQKNRLFSMNLKTWFGLQIVSHGKGFNGICFGSVMVGVSQVGWSRRISRNGLPHFLIDCAVRGWTGYEISRVYEGGSL